MKIRVYFTLLFLIFICNHILWSQMQDCINAQVLCSTDPVTVPSMDGFGALEGVAQNSCFDFWLGTDEHDSHWFTFTFANSGTLELMMQTIGLTADLDFALWEGGCPASGNATLAACDWIGPISPGPFFASGIATDPVASFGVVPGPYWEFAQTINVNPGVPYFLLVNNITDNGAGFSMVFGGTAEIFCCTGPVADPGTPADICEGGTLSLDGSGSSAGPEFNYEWSTSDGNILSGENTLMPTVDAAGTYTLLVTDSSNGCTQSSEINIGNLSGVVASASSPASLDCSNTTLQLSGEGSTTGSNINYIWSTFDGSILDGFNTLSPTIGSAGTYSLTVINGSNGCSAEVSVTVEGETTPPIAMVNVTGTIGCQNTTLFLDGTGSSAGSNISYVWTTSDGTIESGDDTLNPEVSSGGTYELTVTNTDNGCTAIASVTVEENTDEPLAEATASDNISCASSEVTVSGQGSATGLDVTYEWSTSDGQIVSSTNDIDIQVSSTGTYELLVTNTANGCTSTASADVFEDLEEPIADALVFDELGCENTTVFLDGGNSSSGFDITYLWTTNDGLIETGEDTPYPEVSAPGTYELLVTNETNGCTAIATVEVVGNAEVPVALIASPPPLDCSNNSITLDGTASSVGADYFYEWTTPNGQILSNGNTLSPEVGAAGTYLLTVTNALNGCTAEASTTVAQDGSVPVAHAGSGGSLSCAVSTLILDGSNSEMGADITYQWTTTDGNILSGETGLMPEVDKEGTYALLVTNIQNGCTAVSSVLVTASLSEPISDTGTGQTLTCNTTSVQLGGSTTSTGTVITYAWTGPAGYVSSEQTPTVMLAGTYTLEVTNTSNGCTSASSVEVIENNTLPIAEAGQGGTLTCGTTGITLDGSASSSGPDIIYSWTTSDGNIVSGGNGPIPQVNQSGTYTLVVTNNSSGCSASDEVSIQQDADVPVSDAGTNQELTCATTTVQLGGDNTSTGTDIAYSWTGPASYSSTEQTPTVMLAGTYTLEVTNTSNGCTSLSTVEVTENTTPPIAEAGQGEILTCGTTGINLDGSASSSGQDITFSWTTTDGNIVSGDNTPTPQVNQSGSYTLVVTNTANGCSASDEVGIQQDADVPVSDAGSNQELTCTTTAVQLGGNNTSTGTDIAYSWTGPAGFNSTEQSPTIMVAGTYTLEVANTANGCTSVSTVEVAENATPPVADAGQGGTLTCGTTGINLDGTASSSGSEIIYNWSTPDGNIASGGDTSTPEIDQAGTYILLVTNTANSCSASDEVSIQLDANVPLADAGNVNVIPCGTSTLVLDGSGSDTGADIVYNWTTTDGSILADEDSLSTTISDPGTYTLTVTNNQNGCSSTSTLEVTQEPCSTPIAIAAAPDQLTCLITTVELDGSGSSTGPDIIYEWSTADGNIISGASTLQAMVDLPGTYTLTVTNTESGLSDISEVMVQTDTVPPLSVSMLSQMLSCELSEVNVDGTASSSGPNIQYLWTTTNGNIISGSNDPVAVVDAPGVYELVVSDTSNGCTASSTVEVTQDASIPVLTITPPQQLTCNINVVNLAGNVTGAGTYSYTWSSPNGNIVSDPQNLNVDVDEAGMYTLLVTDTENGCTNSATAMVTTDRTPPVAQAAALDMLDCITDLVQIDGSNSSSGTEIIYSWSQSGVIIPDETSSVISVSEAGQYELIVLNTSNGCSSSAMAEVMANGEVIENGTLDILHPLCHNETTGRVVVTEVFGGTPPYLYALDGASYTLSSDFDHVETGDHIISIQDATGCEWSAPLEIAAPPPMLTVDLGNNQEINLGESIRLAAQTNMPVDSIIWEGQDLSCTNCISQELSPVLTSDYTVQVIDANGCTATDVVRIIVKKIRPIYIPNVFSPDDNGINDLFMITAGQGVVEVKKFQIFNRWGEMVFQQDNFQPNDPDNGWDGKYDGELVNPSVYIYLAEIEFSDGVTITYKGDVTLKR